MLVFIGFQKFKTSLTSSIEEGSLGNFFRLSLYSAWRKLVMSLGLRFSSLEANSSFLIIFAGLDEISSVAFRFTRFLTSFLSKERSLVVWLWSRVPDKILVESASVLILTLHFCLFKEQHQDISPDFSILSLRNVYPSTIKHSFPILIWVFTICKSILYEDK
jgi:hypothetical protein